MLFVIFEIRQQLSHIDRVQFFFFTIAFCLFQVHTKPTHRTTLCPTSWLMTIQGKGELSSMPSCDVSPTALASPTTLTSPHECGVGDDSVGRG